MINHPKILWGDFMFAKTYGATTLGIDGVLIEVEADVANGLPKFEIVGFSRCLQ